MALPIASVVGEARAALAGSATPVVVIPVFDAYTDVVQCYEAVFKHTPADVDVLVVDDGSTDRRVVGLLEELANAGRLRHRVVVLVHATNQGFVASMNDAFAAAEGRDVVLVNSDVMPGPGWLEGLRDAATEDGTTATVTPLTNHGTVVSVPDRNEPVGSLPDGLTVEQAALRVARVSRRLRPRIPTAIGHCVYFRRPALEAVGTFDPTFSPGYGEEVDWSQRAVALGFHHVVADDVYVFHRGGASFGRTEKAMALQRTHDAIIRKRYPYYDTWVQRVATDELSPLAAAIGQARRALRGLVVAVDARCLGPVLMGTQLVTIENVRALARHPGIARLNVVVSGELPPYALHAFGGLERVRLHRVGEEQGLRASVDVVYRPFQVTCRADLAWLRGLGERVVVSQLDLIAFHNPAYFADVSEWERYRRLTRLTNFVADGITWLSAYAAKDARQEGLVDAGTPAAMVSCGTDHLARLAELPERCPGQAGDFGTGFILGLGASYKHKNRIFALRIFAELRRRGWSGKIVLAGPLPPFGSSAGLEAEFLLERPDLRDEVVLLGGVTEEEKLWLYHRAGLVLYPTVTEGFGMVPFEAAHFNVPCLASRQASLDEILPRDVPTLSGWDVASAADAARRLLDDREAARAACAALRAQAATFRWSGVADRVVDLFEEVCARPRHRRAAILAEDGTPYGIEELTAAPEPVDPLFATYAWTLHALPSDFREALRAVAQRPTLRRLVFAPAALGYRVVSRMRTRLRG